MKGFPKGHLNKDETLESTILANSTPYAVVIKNHFVAIIET